MGRIKKCIKTSILIALCQSQYFCIVYTLSNSNIEEKNKICRDKLFVNPIKELTLLLEKRKKEYKIEPSKNLEDSRESSPKRSKQEEEKLICEGILSMDMNLNNTKTNNFSLVIPITIFSLASLCILFVLIIFGSYYVWKIFTRKKCMCKVCKKEYEIIYKLGEGGFGEIYKVRKQSEYMILKRCKTENISEADDIIIEAKHLRNLEHKNIVKYIDDFIHIEINKGKLDTTYYVYIIMELCEGGDLKEKIDDRFYKKINYSKQEILDILIQICEGLNYLHNRDIIHRDIKSQNIFLTKHQIRIGDFGLAKKIKKKKNNRTSYMTKVGTDCYMAPEVLQGHNYGKPADIWSLGCVLHELCTLNFMWMHDASISIKVLTDKLFVDTFINEINNPEHEFFTDLIKHMLVKNPELRIKIDTLLKKLKKEKSNSNKKNNFKLSKL